jgi:hypothetical protein
MILPGVRVELQDKGYSQAPGDHEINRDLSQNIGSKLKSTKRVLFIYDPCKMYQYTTSPKLTIHIQFPTKAVSLSISKPSVAGR